MKSLVVSLCLLSTLTSVAAPTFGVICRDDRRMENGALKELILTPAEGGYLLQSQFVPSLHSPDIKIENWAEKLSCRIDDKSTLAFCQNQQGQTVVEVKERRETYFDSLEEDAKKKTTKYTDISVNEGGVEKKAMSFAASHCQTFGSNA
ncbi:MAG TPA: hypothetical protein VEL47_08045 [Myxococcota bacterium]|nr:hypothetical protein [Myxococcota bacterium]